MSEAKIPFRKEMDFAYGEVRQLTPLVRRIVARNPSSFTGYGTNTYIVGRGRVAVIDPGPTIDEHLAAILAALGTDEVSHILLTHTHLDHCQSATRLQERTGGALAGALARQPPPGLPPAESALDDFDPDLVLADGDNVAGDGWTVAAVHTPGHMSNHLCFGLAEEKILFSGDHVMGWNTTIVSPPDGNMAEYFASLEACLRRDDAVYLPGHGPEIPNPAPFVRAYRNHRRMREREIRDCLEKGHVTVPAMVGRMYRHLPEPMHKAAARSVLAHLEHMVATGRIACDGEATIEAAYRPV